MNRSELSNYIYSLIIGFIPFVSLKIDNVYFMLFSFVVSLVILLLFNYDSRILVLLGIFSLLLSAFFDRVNLGNLAWFYFVFGVLGIIIGDKISNKMENSRADIQNKIINSIKDDEEKKDEKVGRKRKGKRGRQVNQKKSGSFINTLSWVFIVLSLPFMFDIWYYAFAKGELHLDIIFIGAGLFALGYILNTIKS
ncbi:hypothetical protein [Acidianus manzaensis]|uniref:Uncharacterized protein n=1 Tax=Acidianus manzaensis TaxID=282676 RepID=A0A1W6JY38_9CREN|nr:hypothetical protein [Acidianus manzaensis]ARM75179.1 hypothetical protein B6F84_03440 [Acidianus manzaensis]